jgi:hypothetical protein
MIRSLDAQFAVQCPAVGKRAGSVDDRRPCLHGASWDVFEDVHEVAGSRAPCVDAALRTLRSDEVASSRSSTVVMAIVVDDDVEGGGRRR